jgi:hypothetical protein
MADDEGGSGAGSLIKGALIVLGGLAAIGLIVSVLKPLMILGVLGGAGYLGYRLMASKDKEIEGSPDRAALPPASDFDRRMRELEKIEKQLDAEIKSHDR